MAFPNKIIKNPATKQDVRFIQTAKDTNGALLEMIATYHAQSQEPAPHYHPHQSEEFNVIVGELTVKIGDEIKVLRAGDKLHIPKRTVHAMWNNSEEKTMVNWKVQPAMETEHLLETISGLAADGKVKVNGMPGILQIALTADKYDSVMRLAKPPYALQKIVFGALKPIAYMAGYRPIYEKYID